MISDAKPGAATAGPALPELMTGPHDAPLTLLATARQWHAEGRPVAEATAIAAAFNGKLTS